MRDVSLSASGESKRHSSTLVACSENRAKFTPFPSHVAPSGEEFPRHTPIIFPPEMPAMWSKRRVYLVCSKEKYASCIPGRQRAKPCQGCSSSMASVVFAGSVSTLSRSSQNEKFSHTSVLFWKKYSFGMTTLLASASPHDWRCLR